MKFVQFVSYYERKTFKKNSRKTDQRTNCRPFYVCKKLSTASFGK